MIFVKPAVCRYPERLQRKRKRARNGRVSAWAAGVPVAGVGPRRFDRRTARTQYRYFRVRFERVEKPISGDFGGLKKGKAVVDFAVENAFLKRAMSGDTTAQIFWLKNRRPDQWRDKPAPPDADTDLLKTAKELLGVSRVPLTEKQLAFVTGCNRRWNIKTGVTGSGKSWIDYTLIIPQRIIACRGEGLIVLMGNTHGTLGRNILEPMRNIWPGLVGMIRADNTAAHGPAWHCHWGGIRF